MNHDPKSASPKEGSDASGVQLLGRRVVCKNRYFTVHFDHIQGQNGTEVHDYLVLSHNTAYQNFITGIKIVPIIEKNKVLLLRSYQHIFKSFFWELPGGFIEAGETPEIAALRELEEETGLVCQPENLQQIGLVTPAPGVIHARVILYMARSSHIGQPTEQNEPGLGDRHTFTLDEIRRMLDNFEIDDALAQIALLHALSHLENRTSS